MAVSLEHVDRRGAKKGRFWDLTGSVSSHGIKVLEYIGMEAAPTRRVSMWMCECPACGRHFPLRRNALFIQKSCGCLNGMELTTNEARDLRLYHRQLMTQPERMCERWHTADAFIADVEPIWTTGHILCRLDPELPFQPGNVATCPSHGGTRKCRVVNVGTNESPEFITSHALVKMLKISRTRLHTLTDASIKRRVMSLRSHQSEGEDPQHPHPHQTESTSP